MNPEIRQFLKAVPANLRPTVTALRQVVLGAAAGSKESVLWRSLSYHRPELGGRVKGAVCLITPKTDHVELGFIHGILLPDPQHLLTGEGVSKRVVRVTPETDLSSLEELIRAAVRIRPTLANLRDALAAPRSQKRRKSRWHPRG
jgi:hypothetical protein